MPRGYQVILGDGTLDPGDILSTSRVQFTTDTMIGTGAIFWDSNSATNQYETGRYYLATNGNIYFRPDSGRLRQIQSGEVDSSPTYPAVTSDQVVSGTNSSELIDSSFVDADGDAVDSGSGYGAGGLDDSVVAGDGDDTILSGAGDDTVFGGAGADSIDGGDGNDVLWGDYDPSATTSSEMTDWSSVAADDTDVSAGFTQTVGGIDVSVSFVDDGNALFFGVESSDTTYVQSGEPFDPNSNLFIAGSGSGATATTVIDFAAVSGSQLSDEVENISFRLNDIDMYTGFYQDILTVNAYDADGNAVTVTLTASGGDTVVGQTVSAIEGGDAASSADGSVLVEIAGPASEIEIIYSNGQPDVQTVWISDVAFDTMLGDVGGDTINGGIGNDTIYGQDGADDLSGGDGDDLIYGGEEITTTSVAESLSWTAQGIDGTDIENGFVQNTGTMDVTVNFTDNGQLDAVLVEDDDVMYVDTGEPFDTTSSAWIGGDGLGDTVTTDIQFNAAFGSGMSDEVANVQFRINDIDAGVGSWQDIISVTALDADGNTVDVTITAAGADSVVGDTITGAEGGDAESDAEGSALVTVAGPVSSISISYSNGDTGYQSLWITDVHFETVPDVGEVSNDILSGDGGADTLYAGAGDDTLTGGTGVDSLYGQDGDDTLYVAHGDDGWGGAGDDTFVISDFGDVGTATITIDGEEDDESVGDTLNLNSLVDRSTLTYTDDGTGSFSGSASLFDGTTLNFSDIENIICFASGTKIETQDGPKAVENLRLGDKVLTRDDGYQTLRWIGARAVDGRDKLAPIKFEKGALPGLERDLLVSPQHRMLISGIQSELLFGAPEFLVAAKHLLDMPGVTEAPQAMVTYYHLMLDRHQILFAEGAETESFYASEQGLSTISTQSKARLFEAFPHLEDDVAAYGETARPCLKAHEARLLTQADDTDAPIPNAA
jgi:Ca2+-binding RTX toxin-like protein